MSHLNDLNPFQREATEHTEGPLLILAGAGAGKTKTLTYRIANLINKGTDPHKILAVTFTNKAASEMRERIDLLMRENSDLNKPVETQERPFVRTFHSLGVYILKQNFAAAGLPKRFTILDRDDSKKIIRDILKSMDYDPKEYEPGKILSIISRQKGDMKSPASYSEGFHKNHGMAQIIGKVWEKYDAKLKKDGTMDFDDLLFESTKLLEKNPEIRAHYQNLWQYIHIDEYQDTNEVQYKMASLLAEKHKNICVVGDVDQNIYSWRGATIKNIMNFEKDYPGTKEIVLEENYRSTQNILQAANEIIEKNTVRKDKNLFTKNAPGEKITVYRAIDEYDEANFAVMEAKTLIAEGVPADEIAFLYRANYQSRVLEEVCLKFNLDHQVIGTRFFDRKEVKDIIAYIKASVNENDFSSMNRIINYPTRGIGKATILKIHANEENDLNVGTQAKIANFRKILNDIRNEIESKKPTDVISFIIKRSGMEDKFKTEGDDGLERLENVKELASLAKKYDQYDPVEALDVFLEDVSLMSDQDTLDQKTQSNKSGVKLMTVHASKGLEFENVFVTGLEAGLFPHNREGLKKEDEEEERRLFYVAITRAKRKLYLTWASFRTIYGSKEVNMASEFLDDISEDLLDDKDFSGEDKKEGGGKMEFLIDF